MVAVDTSTLAAVVDTNVLLDIASCHNLSGTYEVVGVRGVHTQQAVYRRARVREAFLLAMYWNQLGSATYGLLDETRERLLANVDPAVGDAPETHFTTRMFHFILPALLPGWKCGLAEQAARGNAADDHLLAFALEHRLPLVTTEGFSEAGVAERGLRRKAVLAGVPVFTPRELWKGKINEEESMAAFFRDFNRHAPAYIARNAYPAVARDDLEFVWGYCQHVLLGATDGLDNPVAVHLPWQD